MHDQVDSVAFDDADLEQVAIGCCCDEHCQVVEIEDACRVAVGVEDVVVVDPCLRALSKITGSTTINAS